VNGQPGEPEPERELTGRPFLERADLGYGRQPPRDGGPPPPVAHPQHDIRPYLMTGGRTVATGPPVAMETVVVRSRLARNGPVPRQAFERARILQECHRPCSVAEVAARLHLPLGVAAVLVTDLIIDGLLDASTARREKQAHDIELLERLIAGVSAL
jgi:hypothetical protein